MGQPDKGIEEHGLQNAAMTPWPPCVPHARADTKDDKKKGLSERRGSNRVKRTKKYGKSRPARRGSGVRSSGTLSVRTQQPLKRANQHVRRERMCSNKTIARQEYVGGGYLVLERHSAITRADGQLNRARKGDARGRASIRNSGSVAASASMSWH